MASSSDTRSTRIWLEDTHIALKRTRLAQANNKQITFVSALDSRNKRGYNVLLFRPPTAQGKKTKAVTLYGGLCVTIRNHAYQKLFPFVVTRPSSLLPLPPSRILTRHVVKLPRSEPTTVYVVKLQTPEPFRIVRYNVKLHLPGLGPDARYGAKLQPRTSQSPRQYR
jgi:hypothetical protein